ncbi:hypothetical protein L6164_019765 [Bauhinia variegata]|uniref:Uncharacterized protein n=1 Tax=Bauhinia variegata TaxID=167791 RepID=A0ACB9MTP5_BAUVA|nr:hypothetical protein L6164_019765 [Bauhinia variegata]
MEISSANDNCLFPDHLGMEDSNIFDEEYYQYQYQFQSEMDSLMGFPVAVEEVELQPSLSGSGDSYSSYNNNNNNSNCLISKRSVESPESVIGPRPTKQLKTSNSSSVTPTHLMPSTSSSSQIISFDNSSVVNNLHSTVSDIKRKPKIEANDISHDLDFSSFFTGDHRTMFKYDTPTTKSKTPAVARNPVQAQDHVLAERKRREKLTQRFIALSAILPGLKKMDKASVLGAAIKHVENLRERVKTLEEQVTKKTVESAVFVNRSVLSADDIAATSSSDGNSDQPFPEIEARVSGEDVLIIIHCDKHIACVPTVLCELQKLHLAVQSSSFLPFGTTTLHLTVVARMGKEYSMTTKELVKSLRKALRQIVDGE